MTKTNPIDELIQHAQEEKAWAESNISNETTEYSRDWSTGYKSGMDRMITYIKSCHDAPIIETVRTLKFARSCINPDTYHLLQTDGDHVMFREFVDRDDCIEFAQSLGLTAEFIED